MLVRVYSSDSWAILLLCSRVKEIGGEEFA